MKIERAQLIDEGMSVRGIFETMRKALETDDGGVHFENRSYFEDRDEIYLVYFGEETSDEIVDREAKEAIKAARADAKIRLAETAERELYDRLHTKYGGTK